MASKILLRYPPIAFILLAAKVLCALWPIRCKQPISLYATIPSDKHQFAFNETRYSEINLTNWVLHAKLPVWDLVILLHAPAFVHALDRLALHVQPFALETNISYFGLDGIPIWIGFPRIIVCKVQCNARGRLEPPRRSKRIIYRPIVRPMLRWQERQSRRRLHISGRFKVQIGTIDKYLDSFRGRRFDVTLATVGLARCTLHGQRFDRHGLGKWHVQQQLRFVVGIFRR